MGEVEGSGGEPKGGGPEGGEPKNFVLFFNSTAANFVLSLLSCESSRGIVGAVQGRIPHKVHVWASLRSFCASPVGLLMQSLIQIPTSTFNGHENKTGKKRELLQQHTKALNAPTIEKPLEGSPFGGSTRGWWGCSSRTQAKLA